MRQQYRKSDEDEVSKNVGRYVKKTARSIAILVFSRDRQTVGSDFWDCYNRNIERQVTAFINAIGAVYPESDMKLGYYLQMLDEEVERLCWSDWRKNASV